LHLRIAFLSHGEFDAIKNLRPSNFQLEEVFYPQITINQFLDVYANEIYFRPAIEKKWTMLIRDWKRALQQFAIVFEGRMPLP